MTNDEARESKDCVDFMYKIDERNNTIKFIFSDGIVKTANLGALKGIWDDQIEFKKKAEVVISQLRADRDRLEKTIAEIRAEIETIIGEHDLDDYDFCSGLIVARKIIDKHTKEREATE